MRRALACLAGTYQRRTKGGAVKRSLIVVVVLVAAGALAPVAAASGGHSDAAVACQQGGYLTLTRSNGSSFKNTGDCVSYFAQGGVGGGCAVTATSGCLTFDKAVMPEPDQTNYPGWTVTVSAAFSFDTSCNEADPTSTCGAPTPGVPNSYATGGGTYVIKDGNGTVQEQGTLTADDTGTYEGLQAAEYTLTDATPTSCAAAQVRSVGVYAGTNNATDTNVFLAAETIPSESAAADEFLTISGLEFSVRFAASGVTITC
jgi:hypothetical protein